MTLWTRAPKQLIRNAAQRELPTAPLALIANPEGSRTTRGDGAGDGNGGEDVHCTGPARGGVSVYAYGSRSAGSGSRQVRGGCGSDSVRECRGYENH